jgi:Animal haem peroxidase
MSTRLPERLSPEQQAIEEASANDRLKYRFVDRVPLRNRLFRPLLSAAFKTLNCFRPWHRLGWRLGLLNLAIIRDELFRKNLISMDGDDIAPMEAPTPKHVPGWALTSRSFKGTYNDLSDPVMGSIGRPFGRNMKPAARSKRRFDDPNPIDVSRALLQRDTFIPAKSLNLLAAAWIQFQVHDWVNHARFTLGEKNVSVPLPPGVKWRSFRNGSAEDKMRIADNKVLHVRNSCPVFANMASSWWDASELYGENCCEARQLREGARLKLEHGYLPTDREGYEVTGFNESWWLGLSVMHTLFAREHNAICEALQSEYRDWGDQRVYQTSRLILSALIAKIHTVEWTPAILENKAVQEGVRSNWFGPPNDWSTRAGLWLFDAHALKSIRQTVPNHYGVPFSMTEEFVSVYRMHPLIPDDYDFFDYQDGRHLESRSLSDLMGNTTSSTIRRLGLQNALYSFGISNPGAIKLHNFPRTLQTFERRNGEIIDLSVVDILRDRLRRIPRYNDFRVALHKPRLRSFEELSTDSDTLMRLREVYTDIDEVDTMVGLFAETPPDGFGFSDTAFRIFALMASRRLQSDRFLTVDFRPEIYSPLGLDWVDKNTMTSVILRHCPELNARIPSGASAFAPWRPVVASDST